MRECGKIGKYDYFCSVLPEQGSYSLKDELNDL